MPSLEIFYAIVDTYVYLSTIYDNNTFLSLTFLKKHYTEFSYGLCTKENIS
jgi:hypothetical protein